MTPLLTETRLEGLSLLHRGKVRDIYDLGEEVLLVSTDRVSAFDCVLEPGIPYKGAVLNALSGWWLRRLEGAGIATHLVADRVADMPEAVRGHAAVLEGRATLGRKAAIVPVECVVRGYLAGSAVGEYQRAGTIGGEPAPAGLRAGDALPAPMFTPTTKATEGHDAPMTYAEVEAAHGVELAGRLRDTALAVYRIGHEVAQARGLILVDTKIELGFTPEGALRVCDEVLTPDSSRYWEAAQWRPGVVPEPLDKQVVRDHLLAQPWDRTPPAPPLPPEVVIETARRYLKLYRMLTGAPLAATPASGAT